MCNAINVLLLKGGRPQRWGTCSKSNIINYRNDKLNTFLANCGGIEREYNLSGIIIFAMSSLTVSLH